MGWREFSACACALVLVASGSARARAADGSDPASVSANTPADPAAASSLAQWDKALNALREAVWRWYAASAALGPDERGRTLSRDLDDWVMSDAVRIQLATIRSRAARQLDQGDAKAAQATVSAGNALLAEQARRCQLIGYYWQQHEYLMRQRDLWERLAQRLPAAQLAADRTRIEAAQARLTQDYAATSNIRAMAGDVAALEAAYNDARLAAARWASEQRAAAGAPLSGRDRRAPCAVPPPASASTSASQRDHPPHVISVPPLLQLYPVQARAGGIEGSVLLSLAIDATGCIRHMDVVRSSGAPELDEAAMEVAEYTVLTPAMRDGKPVAMRTGYPVNFHLASASAAAAGTAAAPTTPGTESPAAQALRALERQVLIDLRQGDAQDALQASARALALRPDVLILHLWRARAYRLLGRQDQALAEADALLGATDNQAERYGLAGIIDAQSGAGTQAMAAFNRSVQLATDGRALVTRAQFRPYTDLAGRRADLVEALRGDPRSPAILDLLAVVQLQAGSFSEADATVTSALDIAGQNAHFIALRGVVHAREHQAAEAMKDFAAARALAATPAQLNDLCWTLATSGVALPTALDACNAAVAAAPANPAIVDSRAFALLRLGRYAQAIAAYDAALKIAPTEEASLYGRGLAELRAGQRAQGKTDIGAALRIDATLSNQFAAYGLRP